MSDNVCWQLCLAQFVISVDLVMVWLISLYFFAPITVTEEWLRILTSAEQLQCLC